MGAEMISPVQGSSHSNAENTARSVAAHACRLAASPSPPSTEDACCTPSNQVWTRSGCSATKGQTERGSAAACMAGTTLLRLRAAIHVTALVRGASSPQALRQVRRRCDATPDAPVLFPAGRAVANERQGAVRWSESGAPARCCRVLRGQARLLFRGSQLRGEEQAQEGPGRRCSQSASGRSRPSGRSGPRHPERRKEKRGSVCEFQRSAARLSWHICLPPPPPAACAKQGPSPPPQGPAAASQPSSTLE